MKLFPCDTRKGGGHPARRGEEQYNSRDQPAAIILEEVAQLVATQILIHFANEGVTNIRGLRQRASVRSIGDPFAAAPLPHPGLTEAGGASSSGYCGKGKGVPI